MQKIRSGKTILRIRRENHIKYLSKNVGVPILPSSAKQPEAPAEAEL